MSEPRLNPYPARAPSCPPSLLAPPRRSFPPTRALPYLAPRRPQYLADMEDEKDADADEEEEDGGLSFQEQYERELGALKASKTDNDRPLQSIMTRVDCVVIFRANPSVNVTDLVLRVLRDIAQTKTLRTR